MKCNGCELQEVACGPRRPTCVALHHGDAEKTAELRGVDDGVHQDVVRRRVFIGRLCESERQVSVFVYTLSEKETLAVSLLVPQTEGRLTSVRNKTLMGHDVIENNQQPSDIMKPDNYSFSIDLRCVINQQFLALINCCGVK